MTPMFSAPSSQGMPRRSSLAKIVDQSTALLMVCIGSLILLLALLILFHENANATKGYQLRNLELDRSQLLLEEEVQKMEVAQEQSIQTLQNDPVIQSMMVPKTTVYVQGDNAVAYNESNQ